MGSKPPFSRRKFLQHTAHAAVTAAAAPMLSSSLTFAETQPTASDANGSSKSIPITRTIAKWVVDSKPGDIPAAVRKEAVRSVVNALGATVGGSADEAVTAALAALTPYSGFPKANIIGHADKLDPLNASLINGIASHVLDYDDTELHTIIHPAGLVASALFALASDHPMTGAEFLHAFILGTEVECRLGNAIYPSHYDLGWHITPPVESLALPPPAERFSVSTRKR